MAWEHKPNEGSVFANKEKKEDWHADYRGDIMLPDGNVHWIDVTMKKTQAGDVFYKLKLGKVKSIGAPPLSSHSQAKGNGYQPQPAGDEPIPF